MPFYQAKVTSLRHALAYVAYVLLLVAFGKFILQLENRNCRIASAAIQLWHAVDSLNYIYRAIGVTAVAQKSFIYPLSCFSFHDKKFL